jgi:transmembrane sensor
MDHLAYNIEHFVADATFQEYCLGINEQSVSFWEDFQLRHPEKVADMEKARRIYHQLNGNLTSKDFNKYYEEVQTAFYQHIAAPVNETVPLHSAPHTSNWIWTAAAVAACLTIIVFFYVRKPEAGKTQASSGMYVCQPGKKMTITLLDGTRVTLNGGSTLKVDPDYNKTARIVNLDGEGYFIVRHHAEKPFVVNTALVSIRDLGTTFNVKAFRADQTFETSLIEGSIEIISKTHGHQFDPIVLTPNKKIILDSAGLAGLSEGQKSYKIVPLTVNRSNDHSLVETDWTGNRLTFEDDNLDEVVLKLERWYGVKVHITAAADRSGHFNGTFTDEKIEQVLEGFRMSGNFNYKKEGNEIKIY